MTEQPIMGCLESVRAFDGVVDRWPRMNGSVSPGQHDKDDAIAALGPPVSGHGYDHGPPLPCPLDAEPVVSSSSDHSVQLLPHSWHYFQSTIDCSVRSLFRTLFLIQVDSSSCSTSVLVSTPTTSLSTPKGVFYPLFTLQSSTQVYSLNEEGAVVIL